MTKIIKNTFPKIDFIYREITKKLSHSFVDKKNKTFICIIFNLKKNEYRLLNKLQN
jgi:hypothetical protein